MKKYAILLAVLLIFAVPWVGSAAEAPAVEITLLNQDPDPVGPGGYVELRFKVVNGMASTTASDLELRLEPKYPFSLDSGEESIKKVGNLPALGSGDNALIVKYKLRVDSNAVQGTNQVKLEYRHDSYGWIGKDYDVEIETRDAHLAIVGIETIPEKIKPGEEAVVKVMVKNMADSAMRNIGLKLDLTYSGLLDTATYAAASDALSVFNTLPFAPLGTSSEQKIASLLPGAEHEFVYKLITYSDAESRVYKIPVVLSYYDELDNEYQKQDVLGLIVGTKPDMSVVLEEPELYVGKKTGIVSIRFINKGFSDVKFLDIILEDTEEFEVISAREVYVGNVDSDDYETAEFNVYLKNGAAKKEKTIMLPVSIEYRDANNNLYSEKYSLSLAILNPEKHGIEQNSGAGWILLIAVAGIGFFLYRRKKKK